jgi:hypothetical protein
LTGATSNGSGPAIDIAAFLSRAETDQTRHVVHGGFFCPVQGQLGILKGGEKKRRNDK